MRRQFIVVALALLFVSAVAVSADEAVLMDFSLLKIDGVQDETTKQNTQNKATMMDFSGTAGASYTDAQKKQMRTSLAIPNWDVVLASSSRSNMNQALSMTAEVPVPEKAATYGGKTVLGVRVHFPVGSFNSWARVVPPFEIPAYEPQADIGDDGAVTAKKPEDQAQNGPNGTRLSRFEGSYDSNSKVTTAYGVVKNVGTIKTLAVTVRGLNFPEGLSVILLDADGNEKIMFMGYLNFDGWKELRWENPQYVTDVRNRELRIYPLYPKTTPFVKFGGFIITRDAADEGGDFVAYVKDVKILYDKATLINDGEDIDNESVWGIVGQKEAQRKLEESKRFGNQQVLRYMEREKQETSTEFASDNANASSTSSGNK